jgi:hypothetical protein
MPGNVAIGYHTLRAGAVSNRTLPARVGRFRHNSPPCPVHAGNPGYRFLAGFEMVPCAVTVYSLIAN